VIFCVVPEALAPELFDKLTDYYSADPNVTVIIERRQRSRREPGTAGGARTVRDRRRPRIVGELPDTPPGT
jgi:hypothetical protein